MDDALELSTDRLRLVPLEKAHAPALFPLMSDGRVTTYLAWEPHHELAETLRIVESLVSAQQRGAGYHWTVFEGDGVAGLVSLIDVVRSHRSWTLDRAEVAYWIDPNRQGKGIATEATGAVVDCAFERLGLHRVRISHTSENAASGRIPEKLGFEYVGTEREFFRKNGRWFDMKHYQMLADDWKARR